MANWSSKWLRIDSALKTIHNFKVKLEINMHAFRRKTHTTWGVFGSVHAHEFTLIYSFEIKYINETSSQSFWAQVCLNLPIDREYIIFLAPSPNAPLKTAHSDYFLLYYQNHWGIKIYHTKLYEKQEKIACKFHEKSSILIFFSMKFAIYVPKIYI